MNNRIAAGTDSQSREVRSTPWQRLHALRRPFCLFGTRVFAGIFSAQSIEFVA